VELKAIGDVLDQRIRQHCNRAVADPPDYVTRTLGWRARRGAEDRAWVRAVVAIVTDRVEHDVTGRRSALLPEPADHTRWCDWRRTTDTILDAVDVLSPAARTIEVPARRIEAPSMEIGF
jgi:hypothetical protein